MRDPVINPDARVAVHRQGRERQPVLVIDDFLADPDAWRADALAGDYRRIGPHYPGIRSPVPPEPARAMRDEFAPLLEQVFNLPQAPGVLEAFFSVVTTPPDQLAPIQRLPHFDGLEPTRLAILVYLSGAEQGGTAFYRQRETGFETVDQQRFTTYEAALNHAVAAHGLPEPAYIGGDTPLFELIAVHDARSNRALVYRSQLLHCAAIPPDARLPADPATGRLSINSFLFDPPGSPSSPQS